MEPASRVLGRCWELGPSQSDGSLWRRKGSWGKVYWRTSVPFGAARQAHTLEQLGEGLYTTLGEPGWKPHIQLGASPGREDDELVCLGRGVCCCRLRGGLGPNEVVGEAAPTVPTSWLLSPFLTFPSGTSFNCKRLQVPGFQRGAGKTFGGLFVFLPFLLV